jgi:hypothetical protein
MRRRSAWRIALPPLVFLAVVAAALVTRAATGGPQQASIVMSGGVGLIALWALYDGLGRAFGRPRYLGTGQGIDRLFGLIQTATTIGVAVALLPNTLRLIEFAARMALP